MREIMKRAHEIARGLEGDYRARMSLALRQAWKEEKGMTTKEPKGLKEIKVRKSGVQETIWDVKHISGTKYKCLDLDFKFDISTGETDKKQLGEKENIKIGVPFKSASRTITYELVY